MSNDRKNARSTVGAAERAAEKVLADNISKFYSTAKQGHSQLQIADLLSHGQENAVPLRQLVAWTGMDGRSVRLLIAAERRAGVPILSDNATGYFLPGNEGEKVRFIRSMRHRAREIERAADAIENARG